MKTAVSDGYFANGLLVFGNSINPQTVISKGFYLNVPSMRDASIDHLNQFHEELTCFLSAVDQQFCLQIQWSVNSDYKSVLESYKNSGHLSAGWNDYVRKSYYAKFSTYAENGVLKKERLALFFSKKCSDAPKKGFARKKEGSSYLEQQNKVFEEKIYQAAVALSKCTIEVMGTEEHFAYLYSFFNPSCPIVPIGKLNDNDTIFENTLSSDLVFHKDREGCFFQMDGYYHSVFVIQKLPSVVHPCLMPSLTRTLKRDFSITQNIYPLQTERVIRDEEKSIRYLSGTAIHDRTPSLETIVQQKREKIHSLMNGYTQPFEVLTIIRIWAITPRELFEKSVEIKAAINAMSGSKYHLAQEEAQARSLFFQTIPGWTGSGYRDWDLYIENHALASMMPISNSFTGFLDNPEALYEGADGSLVGVKTFKADTPQHAILIGMTGAGKSVAMIDLLSQTSSYYDYTAIIEEGLSYGFWTMMMGAEPIIITPNSNLSFNYLDTEGLPLTNEHISIASKLCIKMVGINSDEDKNNYRSSIICDYLNALYQNYYDSWKKKNVELHSQVLLEAYVIHKLMREDTKLSFVEAYLEVIEKKRLNNEDYQNLCRVEEYEILKFSKDPLTSDLIWKVSFAYFERHEYPTHSNLVELMKYSKFRNHKEDDVNYLATMLSAWCRDGDKGCLLDGFTNVNLKKNIVHFELGFIPESAKEIKEAIGFLISNIVRQHIIKMPRSKRKRIVFEEASRFIDVPGGEKILAEAYAQLRKFSCWVICVTQQYSQLKHSRLKSVIFGNSKLFFLMKQNDREDLLEIAQTIGLPDLAKEKILKYPLPEHMQSHERCSFMTVFSLDGENVSCGTIKIQPDPALLYVASSSGAHYDELHRLLKNHSNPLEAVLEIVEKKRTAA